MPQFHGRTIDRDGEVDRWRGCARLLVATPQCGGRGRIFKALCNKENLVQAFKREMDKLKKGGRKALLEKL